MTSVRRLVRRLAPMALRRAVARIKRGWADWRDGASFADERIDSRAFDELQRVVAVEQPIRRTAHFEGKLHNLRTAAARLNGLSVRPGAVVSFWRAVGAPTERNGYQIGRAIIEDRLSADIGGGLCQAASLLYELGLRAGAAILERHAHSRDLYTQDTRFTPLGLDAAIVWGFKDVRWRNPLDQNLTLGFAIRGETIHGCVRAHAPARTYELDVTSADDCEHRLRNVEIRRRRDGETSLVSRDAYVIDPS